MSYIDWKVGDRVVCIKKGDWRDCRDGLKGGGPAFGEECIISAMKMIDGGMFIRLEGHMYAYSARRFRRVVPRKTDISVFTAMLDKTPVDA